MLCQVVREHYLRDDIQSGTPLDPSCPKDAHKLSKDAPHYLVVDTNIALQQVIAPHTAIEQTVLAADQGCLGTQDAETY